MLIFFIRFCKLYIYVYIEFYVIEGWDGVGWGILLLFIGDIHIGYYLTEELGCREY